ncbi:MAG: DUF5908 family protein [Acidobacteriota bacterium]
MPVEINELIIRAVVDPDRPPKTNTPSFESTDGAVTKTNELTEAATREILEMLRRSKER